MTNSVDKAEKVILDYREKYRNRRDDFGDLTTSKIRNLLSMSNELQSRALDEEGDRLSEELMGQISYVRMRFAYESGREVGVKNFLELAGIFDKLKAVGNDKKKLQDFCRYMEALVAYHKYYGGKEN